MKEALQETAAAFSRGARRAWGAVRRHPWRTAASVPLVLLLYVGVLYLFTPSIGDIRKSKQEQPTVVLSADGKELAVFKRANRDWVKLADVSPRVVDALLATEDHRFHDHMGIDFVRTLRAAGNTLAGDRQGGSTLTQQLARNLYPEEIGRAPTVTRKVKEAITALKIEAVYSKEEILETYLNSVSFLYNAWGIEMASRTYFDKRARDLDDLEAATLVGMLKGTSYYNPVLNPDRALQRRNTVLAQLVKHGKLPQARYDKLKEQPLKLDFERQPEVLGPAPHLAEHLKRWLLEWADKHDYNIYADGLVVHTTIDSRLQEFANKAVQEQADRLQAVADVEWSRSGVASYGTEPAAYVAARGKAPAFDYFWNTRKDLVKVFVRESAEFRELRAEGKDEAQALEQLMDDKAFMAQLRKSKTTLQAGFLALDPTNGHVKAWVGSRDYEGDKFDHVQQARRQPGSTFKPFVYGAAFEQGIQPNETLMDAPVSIQIDRNKFWKPSDVGGGPTNAPMTLREGLARSKNTITAQLMMRVGPSRVASLARAMGVRQSKLEEVPSLALGTSPVTLKEMVTAFGSIANGGNYIEPVVVTRVDDRSGRTLENFESRAPETAMSNQAAMTLLDTLRGVIEQGTAVGLKHRFGLSGDLAGKTGTTQDNTDGWFILMHPQLVTGAWVGFNDNRVSMRSEYWGQGAHNALLLVGDFMKKSVGAGKLDPRATFAAPRMADQEQPLIQQLGDWWNSVFSSQPSAVPPPEVAATPPAALEPPALEPPPFALGTASPLPMPASPTMPPAPAVVPDAPVVVSPQRVPDYPRALEGVPSRPSEFYPRTPSPAPARPAESVSGTQVYRMPESAQAPRPSNEVVVAPRVSGDATASPQPSGEAVLVPRRIRPAEMGAAPMPVPSTPVVPAGESSGSTGLPSE